MQKLYLHEKKSKSVCILYVVYCIYVLVTNTVTKLDASLRAGIKKLILDLIKSEINGKITTITQNVEQIEDKITTIKNSQQVVSNKFNIKITKSWSSNMKQTEPRDCLEFVGLPTITIDNPQNQSKN